MKKTKNILCNINLVLFLVSFALFTVNSFSNTAKSFQSHDHIPQHFTSKQDALTDGSSQQLSEKNETENEGNFEIQALTLPFSVSYLPVETLQQPVLVFAEPLAESMAHPIYVAICNFRI